MNRFLPVLIALMGLFSIGGDMSLMSRIHQLELATGHDAAAEGRAPTDESIASPVAHNPPWTVTAYCPCPKCCGRWADGVTASGEPVTANGGFFVAAPPALPFGTLVVVPGYADGKAVPVLDRGGRIDGRRLDVFFPTHAEAVAWGRRTLTVRIVNEEP